MAGTRGPGAIRPPRRPDSPYPPAPRLVPCLAPGGSRARSPPRCSSQAVGELDLPASRGCCAAAATLAAAALRRSGGLRGGGASRAPGRVRGGGRGGRLPYLPRPVPDPWGRVTAGALPYLPGAAQTLSGSGERRDLITYLSGGPVIAAGRAHDRAGILRGRVPYGGRGGVPGGRSRPGHPPPGGGAAAPLPAVWPDLRPAAQPGAAPEGARRGGPRSRLRVPGVRQGLQRQAQPRGASAHPHGRAALPLPRVRALLQPQAEPAHAPAHPQRREAAPVRAVWPLLPRAALPAQPPAHPRAHARAAPAPPRRLRGAQALLLRPLWQELRARGLAEDPPAQPRPRARGSGGPFRPRALIRTEPAAAADCFPPQSRICDPWRCRWAGAPSLDGILGDREGWLGRGEALKRSGPLPGLGRRLPLILQDPPGGCTRLLWAPVLVFLHRHTQLRAEPCGFSGISCPLPAARMWLLQCGLVLSGGD
ncbi:zinc finger protein LOC728743 homolog isoform X1 [Bos javanicus]|uniref:zinc finger protein LOC728743 homolog isoform X1 n=1 Tax=Bos javanicus TaxID=9906 RepID=UPI002AA5FC5A|nr:zinc finger protein LOC728743 homolog isoform X1 [Bos javanicus]